MGRLVAIHQPNFFPWLGYFDKIARCDTFVFMDDVAFPRTGSGSWVNRVRILVQKEPVWITCPVVRDHGTPMIREVRIDDRQPWRKKLLKTLQHNYSKASHFEDHWDWLQSMIGYETDSLCDFNINAIESIWNRLGLPGHFIRQSSLGTVLHSTELLIEITRAVQGNTYLSGGGAGGYQEDGRFESSGVRLVYQNYTHPEYVQQGVPAFIPGLSILDALFQAGADRISQILNPKGIDEHP